MNKKTILQGLSQNGSPFLYAFESLFLALFNNEMHGKQTSGIIFLRLNARNLNCAYSFALSPVTVIYAIMTLL